jgi:hypothetical protein
MAISAFGVEGKRDPLRIFCVSDIDVPKRKI